MPFQKPQLFAQMHLAPVNTLATPAVGVKYRQWPIVNDDLQDARRVFTLG
jgi:hypothetical protein